MSRTIQRLQIFEMILTYYFIHNNHVDIIYNLYIKIQLQKVLIKVAGSSYIFSLFSGKFVLVKSRFILSYSRGRLCFFQTYSLLTSTTGPLRILLCGIEKGKYCSKYFREIITTPEYCTLTEGHSLINNLLS